ncbi:MAG: translation elongation factor Ts [Calditrichaeota bacterium]|jgi:elongation factor Ts|nr:translation elongation factor Ts [Calditrichota bacterium]
MSPITAKDVKDLRDKTGLGMMDCKKALVETNGNFEEAIDYLRKKGVSKGAARQGRATGEGVIDAYIHPGSKVGILIEVGCETDFVARSDEFVDLVHNLAMQVAAAKPTYVSREDVPEDIIEHEKEIYREQLAAENKPAQIIEKISQGKLDKFFKENCLIEQLYIKDTNQTVSEVVLTIAGKFKENIQVRRFASYILGE